MWPNRVKVAISSIFSYIFFPTYFSPTLFCWPSLHEIYGDIFAVKLSRNFPRNWIPDGWSLEIRMADDEVFLWMDLCLFLKVIFSWPLLTTFDHFWCFWEWFVVFSSGYPLQLNWLFFSILFLSAQSIIRFSKVRL